MPKSWTDEAIVLRTYNVGETDRFCLLLTEHHGRIAARAGGVRRLLSHRGGALLPLHRISVVCELHSFGVTIASVVCLDAHARSWKNPQAFACAEQGIELLLKLTEDGLPMPQIYRLTSEFLSACSTENIRCLSPVFTLKLLSMLGLCPSLTHSSIDHAALNTDETIVLSRTLGGLVTRADDPVGMCLSKSLLDFFRIHEALPMTRIPILSNALLDELLRFVQGLLGSQLGLSLKAPGVSFAMSSAVTPI